MLDVLKEYILYLSISTSLLFLFNTICTWRMFVKAGIEGFWSIVPIVNIVKFFQISKTIPVLQILGILVCSVGYFIQGLHKLLIFTPLIGIVFFSLGMSLMNIKLMERFGYRSLVWILVSVFCPIIGYSVVAFNPYTEYEW